MMHNTTTFIKEDVIADYVAQRLREEGSKPTNLHVEACLYLSDLVSLEEIGEEITGAIYERFRLGVRPCRTYDRMQRLGRYGIAEIEYPEKDQLAFKIEKLDKAFEVSKDLGLFDHEIIVKKSERDYLIAYKDNLLKSSEKKLINEVVNFVKRVEYTKTPLLLTHSEEYRKGKVLLEQGIVPAGSIDMKEVYAQYEGQLRDFIKKDRRKESR